MINNKELWEHPWIVIETYEHEHEKLVERLGVAPLPTKHGDFTLVGYGDEATGEEHFALVKGDFMNGSLGDGEGVMVRVHSSCVTSEVFDAINCECPEQKEEALEKISKSDKGVLVYLHQEGRGNGTKGKLAQLANMFHFEDGHIVHDTDTDTAFKKAGYEGERRSFRIAGAILHDLGVISVHLMTNNPRKIEGVRDAGIEVIDREAIEIPASNGIIFADLAAKRDMLGHMLHL